jgi:hypothetical protein
LSNQFVHLLHIEIGLNPLKVFVIEVPKRFFVSASEHGAHDSILSNPRWTCFAFVISQHFDFIVCLTVHVSAPTQFSLVLQKLADVQTLLLAVQAPALWIHRGPRRVALVVVLSTAALGTPLAVFMMQYHIELQFVHGIDIALDL